MPPKPATTFRLPPPNRSTTAMPLEAAPAYSTAREPRRRALWPFSGVKLAKAMLTDAASLRIPGLVRIACGKSSFTFLALDSRRSVRNSGTSHGLFLQQAPLKSLIMGPR
jgi:hypothetical protein